MISAAYGAASDFRAERVVELTVLAETWQSSGGHRSNSAGRLGPHEPNLLSVC